MNKREQGSITLNKIMIILIMLSVPIFASEDVTIKLDQSGTASVVLSIYGESDATIISMPRDAEKIGVIGGSYAIENGNAIINPGSSGFTTFSFKSSILTRKINEDWELSFSSSNESTVYVHLPAHAAMISSHPRPSEISAESSMTILKFEEGDLRLEYRQDTMPPVEEDKNQPIILALILGSAIVIAAYLSRSRPKTKKNEPERKASLDITPGKTEMMETINRNDLIIVKYLLSYDGKSKRNVLERKTNVGKSSLAKAIDRLEKRRIIEIDRTSTTHFVRLSEYFLKL